MKLNQTVCLSFCLQELIQIEESWQKESREQTALIGRLQEESRRLKAALSEQKQAVVEEVAAVTKSKILCNTLVSISYLYCVYLFNSNMLTVSHHWKHQILHCASVLYVLWALWLGKYRNHK